MTRGRKVAAVVGITAAMMAGSVGVNVGLTFVVARSAGKTFHAALNGSSDGRFHTCGYVTEDGVTEYLAAYRERCGK